MGEPAGRRRKRSWIRPLGDPAGWSAADKCLLIIYIMLPGVALFAIMGRVVPGWLYMPAGTPESADELVNRLVWFGGITWTLMLAVGLLLRKHAPENRTFVVVTIAMYSLTIAIFVCLSGAFHSPGWILFLGGAVVGFLLFGRRLTFMGIGIFGSVFATVLALSELGYLGDFLILTQPPPARGDAWTAWLLRMGLSTVVFGGMTLGLCSYVIAMLHDRERRLDLMSKTDALTGLYNRRHLMELFEAELARARRYETPLSVVMIDLDHFKEINDKYGHLVGDDVLIGVSRALEASVRESDAVGRYGGEEFVLLLPNTDQRGARELAERCRELVAASPIITDGAAIEVTASMGIASFPADVDGSVDKLLGAADDALYRAKSAGRNRVELAAAS